MSRNFADTSNTRPGAGGVSPAGATGGGVVQNTQLVTPEDRVRWGPVWAGLLTALTTFLLLELLAYGLGLLTTTEADGTFAASGASPWVSGVLGLLAFFLGGYVAERSSAARGGSVGLLNGFLVWALGTVLILLLSVLGLGSLFGALGNVAGQFVAAGGHVSTGASANVSANQVAQVTQSAALGAFFSLLLSAAAAALGGLLGSPGRAAGFLRAGR